MRAAIADPRAPGVEPAALLIDTIFSADRVLPDAAGFPPRATAAVREAGALLIADEVQPGFRRTGTMWGLSRHGVVPTSSRSASLWATRAPGGGSPCPARAARPVRRPHARLNTFSGNPVSCAVRLAVLDVLRAEGLVERAGTLGTRLRHHVAELQQRHELIGDVRGAGLFVGVELVKDRATQERAVDARRVVESMRDRGVRISTAGLNSNVLKIRPPLAFDREHADLPAARFDATLDEVGAAGS